MANSEIPLTVTPTLRVAGRDPIQLAPISLASLASSGVTLTDFLPSDSGPLWGTVVLEGETDGIVGWVTSGSQRTGKTSESIFRRAQEAGATVVGHWARGETRNQRVSFLLQNVSDSPQSIRVDLSNPEGMTQGSRLEIGPRGTLRVSLRQLTRTFQQPWSPTVGTARFSTVSGNKALLGQILIDRPDSSFLIATDLAQPARSGSSRLDMAGGPAGTPGLEWGFPRDASFSTYVVVANLSKNPLTVRSRAYGQNRAGRQITVENESLALAPGQTRLLPMTGQAIAGGDPFQTMSLDHDGAPEDLSAIGYTVQANGKTGFACPFAGHGNGAFLKPVVSFDISDESTTLFILRNISDEPITVDYGLSYLDPAGVQAQYAPAALSLAPDELRVINVKHLRDLRVPDRLGTVLPAGLTRGSALVASSVPGALLVADPTVDRKSGGVRLCQLYCNSEIYYSEDGSTVPCFLLMKYTPTVRIAGRREFTLTGNTPVSGGFDCSFAACPHPSPICRGGRFTRKNRPFCPPGLSGILNYTEKNLWIFRVRFCFLTGVLDLATRPC